MNEPNWIDKIIDDRIEDEQEKIWTDDDMRDAFLAGIHYYHDDTVVALSGVTFQEFLDNLKKIKQ